MDWARPNRPTTAGTFAPKLLTVFREGYGWPDLGADAVAGATVAIVALPLSMAIAIASGLNPDRGLNTVIVGGLLVSALGGSRFQIGGPAGAFIALIYSIVERHGYDGLALATLVAGGLMLLIGLLRLGTYVKYMSHPVTVGFTSSIAVIIFASQIKELLGLQIAKEPAALLPKLSAIGGARPGTLAVSLLAVALIAGVRRLKPKWPAILIAVGATAVLTALLRVDVATIGTRFGGLPHALPAPVWPSVDPAKLRAVLPDAFALTLLGTIESLLSAVVADGMSGRRHRSNAELVAQGVANVGAAVFGGMPVTGTIARTATNVRSGARGPVSGILHAVYVLLFILFAAPLASYVPLATLAAVLAVVAWHMAGREEFVAILRSSKGDAAVLLATFLLTVFEDLTTGIAVGVTLAAFLTLHRLAEAVEVEKLGPFNANEANLYEPGPEATGPEAVGDDAVLVYRVSGALFFGAATSIAASLDRIGAHPRVFVFDFSGVTLVDGTAARSVKAFADKLLRGGSKVCVCGARPSVRDGLMAAGLREPELLYAESLAHAQALGLLARRRLSAGGSERACDVPASEPNPTRTA